MFMFSKREGSLFALRIVAVKMNKETDHLSSSFGEPCVLTALQVQLWWQKILLAHTVVHNTQ